MSCCLSCLSTFASSTIAQDTEIVKKKKKSQTAGSSVRRSLLRLLKMPSDARLNSFMGVKQIHPCGMAHLITNLIPVTRSRRLCDNASKLPIWHATSS
ncbi:hypothetical protein BDN67DRAFT_659861 [Paxillus ammoniavirescens]|nr:hypothetical protein BDN67DRAFT_659861 [Paxillus ammoniavirescens]